MAKVTSISWTEARMVVVRSCETLIRMEGGMEACKKGKRSKTRSDCGDGIGSGLLIYLNEDRGLAVDASGIQPVELIIDHLSYIREAYWGALVIGNDEGRVLPGDEELVIVVQNKTAVVIGQRALGDIGVGLRERNAHLVQADAELAEQERIDLHTNGRLRTAANVDLAHTTDLRNLLSQDGVGHIVQLLLSWPSPR